MSKPRASFLKRQREMAKREQRAAKMQRKLARRAAATNGPPDNEIPPETAPDSSEPSEPS